MFLDRKAIACKSSAVDEMGDRLTTTDMGRKVYGGLLTAVPFSMVRGAEGTGSQALGYSSNRLATIHQRYFYRHRQDF